MNQDAMKSLELMQKAISTSTMGGVAGLSTNVLVRENLSGYINDLAGRKTNVRDRLTRETGSGLAAAWNVMTALTYDNSAFAEGAKPAEDNAAYERRFAQYKSLGKSKKITSIAIAAGANFANQEAIQTENAMREVIVDEEKMIFNGDATGTPTEFDGMATLVTTNVEDDANSVFGWRTDLADQAVEGLTSTYNVDPTAIYCGFGMQRAINQSLQGDIRADVTNGNVVTAGLKIGFVQTLNGVLPVVPTIGITGDNSTYPSYTVEDFYVVTESHIGQNVLYMSDLIPLSKEMLAKVDTSTEFMVWEATVLVNRAEEMHYKFENVRVKG